MITETFQEYDKARDYIQSKGFEYFRGKHISMGEGYEHIFLFEYQHKNNTNLVCRMADLRFEQYKIKSEDQIPRIIGFIQVSIKDKNQDGNNNSYKA